MDKSYLLMIAAVAIMGGALFWSIFSWSKNSQSITGHSDDRYQQAVAVQNQADPCQAPEGYTDQAWQEHMSHHPDQYKGCL